MSLSDALSDELILAGLDKLAERAASGKMDEGLLQRIVTATVAIFARSCEQAGFEQKPVGDEVSTTDAVRLAVALARSQSLTPFDLSLWFARRGGIAPTVRHTR